jgi:hypothetical protein
MLIRSRDRAFTWSLFEWFEHLRKSVEVVHKEVAELRAKTKIQDSAPTGRI